MFEFLNEVANNIVSEMENCISQMEAEADSYEKQANENEKEADSCDAQALVEEASCPHYKEEERDVVDDEGNHTTESFTVPDYEADEAARQRAVSLREKAVSLRAAASMLISLAASIRSASSALDEQVKKFNQAIVIANQAINYTSNLLNEASELTVNVIAAFNVTDVNNFNEWVSNVGANLIKVFRGDLQEKTNEKDNMSFEEAKEEAKEKYAKYINSLDGYTEEEKTELINKFNEQIDKAVVLSDEEFTKRFGAMEKGVGVVAVYNGPEDRAYVRAGYEGQTGRIIHEIGGHGTGTLCEKQGYFYIDPETNDVVIYTGKYEEAPYTLTYGTLDAKGLGMTEATTEYFTRRIDGDKRDGCSYNVSTDALEKIMKTMTKYGNVDAEKLLLDSYTGNDKGKFERKFNEMMENDEAYELLDDYMYKANNGDVAAKKLVEVYAMLFEFKCKNKK